ncbi:MAG: organic solvent ABC transporter substrate-binding protein [Rhizobiaceae bacterium MnEN-MB40S]|nr:MAG: organic solvent ABC transporter substrate-binding protein [Rhizobiaceae bacterium MnEN-MB40S]
METKANYTIVGIVIILIITAGFMGVYWMATANNQGETARLEIRIPGSASGLSVGAPVLFNGIRVGSVRSLTIDGVDPNYVLAMTEVRATAPVYASTKAVLGIQGLTGSAHIELSGGNTSDLNILEEAVEKGSYAVLTADESSVTNLLATADAILQRVNKAVVGIEEFVTTAKGPLTQTVQNAEKFSEALAANSGGVDSFLKNVSSLSKTLEGVSGKLEGLVTRAEAIVAAVEPAKVSEIVQNVETVSKNISDASGDFKPMIEEFKTAATNIAELSQNAESAVSKVEGLLNSVDTEKVQEVVDNITVASAQAREGIANLTMVSETIGQRNQEIGQIIENTDQLTARLNEAALQVQTTLNKLNGVIDGADGQGLVAEAKDTLKSFQDVANKINAQIGPIMSNVDRFSNSGLKDIEALVNEARRSVARIERAVAQIGEDPQSLIFGGSGSVKQYDGRRRR